MNWIKQFSLENQVAVVTGAAGGLGRELVKILFDAGAHLVLADTDEASLRLLLQATDPSGERVRIQQCDVTNEKDILFLIEQTNNHFKRIDVLVNCAGNAMVFLLACSLLMTKSMAAANAAGSLWVLLICDSGAPFTGLPMMGIFPKSIGTEM